MMYCCHDCFCDENIRRIIEQEGFLGDCCFCLSKGVKVIDITKENKVTNQIIGLLDIYEMSNSSESRSIEDSLKDDWNIFKIDKKKVRRLIEILSKNKIINDDILSSRVIIPQLYDEEFLSEYSITRGLSWGDFSDYIKNVNRFHTKFNPEEFSSYLSMLVRKHKEGSHFYRARIAKNKTGYDKAEMKAPPKGCRSAGRINPEGMLALYLSLDEKTVLYEIRANMYDYVSIGEFVAKRDLRIVDLSQFEYISPFDYGGALEKFAVNFKVFQDMAREISKPLRRNDSQLEYLPTQFITEYIKSEKYDGVAYRSTISNDGINIALFNEDIVDCIDVKTVEINYIEYRTSNI